MSFFNHVLLRSKLSLKYISQQGKYPLEKFLHFIMPLMLGLWQIERKFVLGKAAEALVG